MMPRTTMRDRLVTAQPEERPQISSIIELLDSLDTSSRCYLADSRGKRVDLPPSVAKALTMMARAMAQGQSVALIRYDHELTTQEAADLLNVSRPYLIRLLEDGIIPYHMVGTHRRIRMKDLLEYKARRDQLRRATLDELQRLSDALGLYDEDEDPAGKDTS